VVQKKNGDGWSDRVRKEEVLQGAKEKRNILHAVKRRKAIWVGHIWRRNWLKEREGRIDVTVR
jgi:hypothetical protein